MIILVEVYISNFKDQRMFLVSLTEAFVPFFGQHHAIRSRCLQSEMDMDLNEVCFLVMWNEALLFI